MAKAAWVVGNWKQNPTTDIEATTLALSLRDVLVDTDSVNVMIAPSFVHLECVIGVFSGSPIQVASQDVAYKNATTGAYTGDVSAAQVAGVGATWTLIGHSERRQYHHEDNVMLAQKICHAIGAGLRVIFCVGETKTDYDTKATMDVLASQLQVLNELGDTTLTADNFVIAYEPVWAIGTGLVPTTLEISMVHQYIKRFVSPFIGGVSVLYGGSVNDINANELAQCADIDGVLVGGASLKPSAFATIVQAFNEL